LEGQSDRDFLRLMALQSKKEETRVAAYKNAGGFRDLLPEILLECKNSMLAK
jgi:hypothetical protein